MSTSVEQILANRENAQRSTGPVTPEGKRKSSLNGLKHSFAGHTCFVQAHELGDYIRHFEAFRQEYLPVGPTEQFMVQSLAEISWSAQNIRSASSNAFTVAGNREWTERSETRPPHVDSALGCARAVQVLAKEINLFSIYENRKMRLFHTTRHELIRIQTERRDRQLAEMQEAAKYRKLCKLNRDPNQPEWKPEDFGFACSLESIDSYIAQEDGLALLRNKAA